MNWASGEVPVPPLQDHRDRVELDQIGPPRSELELGRTLVQAVGRCRSPAQTQYTPVASIDRADTSTEVDLAGLVGADALSSTPSTLSISPSTLRAVALGLGDDLDRLPGVPRRRRDGDPSNSTEVRSRHPDARSTPRSGRSGRGAASTGFPAPHRRWAALHAVERLRADRLDRLERRLHDQRGVGLGGSGEHPATASSVKSSTTIDRRDAVAALENAGSRILPDRAQPPLTASLVAPEACTPAERTWKAPGRFGT